MQPRFYAIRPLVGHQTPSPFRSGRQVSQHGKSPTAIEQLECDRLTIWPEHVDLLRRYATVQIEINHLNRVRYAETLFDRQDTKRLRCLTIGLQALHGGRKDNENC